MAIKETDKGNLVKREKILGVPSYVDVARNITVGTTYHTIYYGLNSMGSYAAQMNTEETLASFRIRNEIKTRFNKIIHRIRYVHFFK